MTLRLTEMQHLWLIYKEWHENFVEEEGSEPDRSWGPGPTSTELCKPREFFNIIWDFTDYRDDLLVINDEFIKLIAKEMTNYCRNNNGFNYNESYKETYDTLIKQAKQLGCLNG